MTCIIKINMDNAALKYDPSELGRIFKDLSGRCEYWNNDNTAIDFPVRDSNGNTVGKVTIK